MNDLHSWWRPQVAPFEGSGVVASDVLSIMQAPEFPALIEEYAREAAVVGLPSPKAKIEHYQALEMSGAIHAFAAVKHGELVGFISVLAPVLPHYGVPVAVSESFFVAAAHRKGGAGLRLLAAAERKAKDLGSPGLLVCAPFEGRLFELLPRCGYRETNRVYFKGFFDA